ncbi:MAG: hypothetical protein P4M11_11205 [Candidatus Pacebacteria bacterium]|nr:hypothetical protein [Candidatus Paceibacterota bacterium]
MTFNPSVNCKSMQIVENDRRGLVERNNSYVQKRNLKLLRELPTGMKECTFRPQLLNAGDKAKSSDGDVVKRLHSYLEHYESRRSVRKANN